jgi:hypothetical protein
MEHVPAQGPHSGLSVKPVQVKSVPACPPITVKFLGPLRGLLTHWQKGHSVPCDGAEQCPTSLHRSGTFFKAYAPCEEWIPHLGRWRPIVLEATANLEEYLRGRTLRGEVWMLSREKEADRQSPVAAAYLESLPDGKTSLAFDIKPVLLRLYNRTDLVLDVANPTPSRIILPEVVAPPPSIPADLQPPPPIEEDPDQREKLRKILEEGRRKFGPPPSTRSTAGHNGQKPSPAGSAGNGATGNGHF